MKSTSTLATESSAPRLSAAPRRPTLLQTLAELSTHRELLYFLVWRDIKVRYKQTLIGAGWAVVQPLFLMVVLQIFLGRLLKAPSNGIPYPLFTFSALLPWQLFSSTLTHGSNSLVTNQQLITKVYFPRVLLPLASALGVLADFLIAFSVLVVMLATYRIAPSWSVLTLPVFVVLAAVAAFGTTLWLSAVNVQYRDVRQGLGLLIQVWLFATPIAYPTSIVPERWQPLYALNPMVGAVEGFRWALFGKTPFPIAIVAISAIVAVVVAIGGWSYFRKTERWFADII
jgi:lipopolysaccharide transport system permease protein